MKRCFHCFETYDDSFYVCPACGAVHDPEPKEPIYLRPGTILVNRYIIGEFVGAGGFGIVYRAWDTKLENIVAIKEFFPQSVVTRAEGQEGLLILSKKREEYEYRKKRFLLEARTMAKFGKHRNIPNVFEFFEANESAYIVMELLEGEQLSAYISQLPEGKVDLGFSLFIANEIGQALKTMHEAKVIHRDVAPDNIFICSGKDIRIKLMDLGAAKIEDSSDDVIDLCMKVGYSPVEQYDKTDNFGPWSDIYAMGATLYFMLTGVKPEESTSRKKEDHLPDVNEINPEVPENINNAIMKALAVNANERFSNIDTFLKALNGEKKVLSLDKEKKKKKLKIVAGILSAVAVIAVALAFGLSQFREKRNEKYLPKAEISVWYLEDGDNPLETQALNTIVQNFNEQEGYDKVTISLTPYTNRMEYEEALRLASEHGTLPAIFESTGVGDSVLQSAHSAEEIIHSAQEIPSFSRYEDYYKDYKRIPLAIDIPLAYVLVRGEKDNSYVMDYQDSYFGKGTFSENKVYLEQDKAILRKNDLMTGADKYDDDDDEWSVILGSTSSYNRIKTFLADKWFAIKVVPIKEDRIYSSFTYEWSIGSGSPEEINAAEHFASWLLGANAQANLLGSTGLIPVNENALSQKSKDNDQWKLIEEIKDRFDFGK